MAIPDSAAHVAATHLHSQAAQDLILRATFLRDDRGLEAWRKWKSTVDLDGHLDLGSFRLLPETSRRLRQRGIDDPLLEKFAGISKKHWLANRLFFRQLELLVTHLHACDVRVMVPAGVALALQHLPDHPLDPVLNHAVLVRASQAVTAFEVLDAAGWSPTPRITASLLESYVSARSCHSVRAPDGSRLRVQWHVLPQRATGAADRHTWSRATDATLGDRTVATSSPADQLVQLCSQRVGRCVPPLFVRAADVMMLLSACSDEVDWTQVAQMAGEPGLTLPIQETLTYLQDRLEEPVPTDVFERIHRQPTSRLERVEYELTAERPSWLGEVLAFWLDYRRSATTNLLVSSARFPRFLQHYFTLPHLWQIPFRILAAAADHVRERTGKTVRGPRTTGDAPAPGR